MRSTITAAAVVLSVVGALTIACQPSESKSAPPTDAATLQARIDALKPGDTLKLDNTTYPHSGVIKVHTAGVHIDGNGATLQATEDATSSVQILADDVQLTNITLTAPPDGPRMTGLDQHKLVLAGNRDSVSGITINGSAAAGIFVNGAQNFSIKDVHVSKTRADGVHMTAAAANGVLDNIRTDQTGDDGVAVVSYGNAAPCHDITETNITVAGTRWGRGISVVGGTGVTVRGFTVSNTSAAGLYVATEGSPYFTRSVDRVEAAGGSITAANQDPTVVNGAILVTAGNPGTTVQGVNISNVNIAATTPTAERNVAVVDDAGTVKNIVLRSIRIDSASLPALSGDTSPPSVSALDWTVAGAPTTVN
jgi:hypothetical protein